MSLASNPVSSIFPPSPISSVTSTIPVGYSRTVTTTTSSSPSSSFGNLLPTVPLSNAYSNLAERLPSVGRVTTYPQLPTTTSYPLSVPSLLPTPPNFGTMTTSQSTSSMSPVTSNLARITSPSAMLPASTSSSNYINTGSSLFGKGGSALSANEKERMRMDRLLSQLGMMDWEHKEAIEYLGKLVEMPEIGVPDSLSEIKGGRAIWMNRKVKQVFTRSIYVVDECINVPCLDNTCCTFVYVEIDFNTMDCKCENELMTVTRKVIIDSEKGTITARGDSLEMCMSLLSIFTGIGVCRVEVQEAVKGKAMEKGALLGKTSEEDYQKLLKSLQENVNYALTQ